MDEKILRKPGKTGRILALTMSLFARTLFILAKLKKNQYEEQTKTTKNLFK